MDIETLHSHLGELLKAGLPKNTPVIISNIEGGFDAAVAASVKKVIHCPTKGCAADYQLPSQITTAHTAHKVIGQMVSIEAFVIADNDY